MKNELYANWKKEMEILLGEANDRLNDPRISDKDASTLEKYVNNIIAALQADGYSYHYEYDGGVSCITGGPDHE